MTRGLTINQAGFDNEIFSLKSSDIDHKLVNDECGAEGTETDTFFAIQKHGATGGNVIVSSWGTNYGMYWKNHVNGGWTTQASNQGGSYQFIVYHHACDALTTMTANTNLFTIGYVDGDSCARRFHFDKEGSAHADVEWTEYDDYCDIELLRGVHSALTPDYKSTFGQDMMYNLCQYTDMKLIGKDSVHWEHTNGRDQLRGMVNFTHLAMLHHSTIIQMADRFSARIDGLETQLKALQGGK